ncbi:unnamed protein product [Psylliodes chrysocephalus]|uniref:Uncharacterized protein n=1 Tax=Psylliodes chrysocephalus TaxID=3402493 RepID=A0A9P0DE60_9CUCU|nr:unnamed protein product [Psylliodes chrysocephala]
MESDKKEQEQNLQEISINNEVIDVTTVVTFEEANVLLNDITTKYNEKCNDRKTLKQALLQKIAGDMKNKGFDIQEGREGAEKSQKFANKQRSYLNYMKNIKTTGTEIKDPPPYFDEMHAILGNKDKVNPP